MKKEDVKFSIDSGHRMELLFGCSLGFNVVFPLDRSLDEGLIFVEEERAVWSGCEVSDEVKKWVLLKVEEHLLQNGYQRVMWKWEGEDDRSVKIPGWSIVDVSPDSIEFSGKSPSIRVVFPVQHSIHSGRKSIVIFRRSADWQEPESEYKPKEWVYDNIEFYYRKRGVVVKWDDIKMKGDPAGYGCLPDILVRLFGR